MTSIVNESELIRQIEANNYYYRGNNFESYSSLQTAAEEYFKSITADYDDVDGYYERFGGVHVDKVRNETYYNEEGDTTLTVHFYESYIDSGVPAEDYFYGFFITEQ